MLLCCPDGGIFLYSDWYTSVVLAGLSAGAKDCSAPKTLRALCMMSWPDVTEKPGMAKPAQSQNCALGIAPQSLAPLESPAKTSAGILLAAQKTPSNKANRFYFQEGEVG